MANFKVKNGIQAGRYLLNSTTLSGSTIDLSLGSMFSTTLSSDPAYAFTNPPASGNAQAFSVEVTGGTTTFTQDSFATTLYTGNGSTQTITNGIDLSGDGGLVWTKVRDQTGDHALMNSESSWLTELASNKTDAEGTTSYVNFVDNSNGYSMNTAAFRWNESARDYVSWTFKKQAKFFDVVTYTGNGANRSISHSLGSEPGMIIIKRTDASESWQVYHRGLHQGGGSGLTAYWASLELESTGGQYGGQRKWGAGTGEDHTDSTFFVSNLGSINASGGTFVAYLFAHDTASDSRIQCGSYSSTGLVNLGWKPQWLLIKSTTNTSDYTGDWRIFDNKRGVIAGDDNQLFANSNRAEDTATFASAVEFVNTGFNVESQGNYGTSTIYIAIRGDSATDSAITWPSSVKWPSGLAPTTPAPGTKDLFTFLTTDGGTTYYGKKAAEGIA